MLNHFVQPATFSTGQAVEGLQPVRGYLPHHQMASLVPSFQLPGEGGRPEDEKEREPRQPSVTPSGSEDTPAPDIFRLAVNLSFQEMIRLFLVPGHEKVLSIRSRLRQARGVSELKFFIPVGATEEFLEERREELYEVQLQLFRTPKGLHCHIII